MNLQELKHLVPPDGVIFVDSVSTARLGKAIRWAIVEIERLGRKLRVVQLALDVTSSDGPTSTVSLESLLRDLRMGTSGHDVLEGLLRTLIAERQEAKK